MQKLTPVLFGLTLIVSGLTLFHAHPDASAMSERPHGKPEASAKVPEFTLKRVSDNKEVASSEFNGKVRLIDFWATWCPPCKREIPDFIELQKAYGPKGLQIIGIAMDRNPSVVPPFVKEQGMNYPVFYTDDKVGVLFGNITSYPTTFLVDRQGNVVERYIGFREKAVFEKDIKALL